MGEHSASWRTDNYWRCNEYEGGDTGGSVGNSNWNKIQAVCETVATTPGWAADNGRFSFVSWSKCEGHRNQNNKNLTAHQFYGVASAYQINDLRKKINQEITDRRKHDLYKGNIRNDFELSTLSQNEYLSALTQPNDTMIHNTPTAMTVILTHLNAIGKKIAEGTGSHENDFLEDNVKYLPTVESGNVVAAWQLSSIHTVLNTAIKDCICYSDCNDFGVCGCYGYCNCNY